jgi:hypothetical protein
MMKATEAVKPAAKPDFTPPSEETKKYEEQSKQAQLAPAAPKTVSSQLGKLLDKIEAQSLTSDQKAAVDEIRRSFK